MIYFIAIRCSQNNLVLAEITTVPFRVARPNARHLVKLFFSQHIGHGQFQDVVVGDRYNIIPPLFQRLLNIPSSPISVAIDLIVGEETQPVGNEVQILTPRATDEHHTVVVGLLRELLGRPSRTNRAGEDDGQLLPAAGLGTGDVG